MKFNKKVQYGILFALHLSRVGKTTVDKAAGQLSVPKSFLEQVARQLRMAGVVTSTRGPTGGYSLTSGATLLDVVKSLTSLALSDDTPPMLGWEHSEMTKLFMSLENRVHFELRVRGLC